MTDYQEIGLKSGIEIHQQLATHKLFCPCPSEVRQTKPDFTVKRELRPLAGELGEIDPAAIFERKKRKYYIYEAYDDTTCLVELDEEPPHPVNPEALDIALLIAKMLHCKFPDVVQVMRKTVINGSNTSGFQRTALIGYDGFIETSFGKVGIQSVALEEDAARRTAENPESVTFRLDRLGIPLVEIATAPDCKTPEQIKELAEKLGSLLRSTGKVIRGIGTIRQDVNISTKGHPRIELKGVQELPHMPNIVELEAQRQQDAIKKGEKIVPHVRNILPDLSSKFLRPMPGAARMYPETDLPLIFLDSDYISNIKLPESTDSVKNKLQKLGLSVDLVDQLATSEKLPEFEKFSKKYHNLNSNLVATTMLVTPKEVKRKLQLQEFDLQEDILGKIISALDEGTIVKESVSAIMEELAKNRQKDADSIISKYKLMSDAELKKEIAKLQKEFKGPPDKLVGVAIGKFRGKASAQKIIELLKK